MDKQTTILSKAEKILIETDELIFPVRIEQILYAEITKSHTIRFYEAGKNYQFPGNKNVLASFLKLTGFIPVQANLFVNPCQISEYNIKDQIVRFPAGLCLDIHPKFRKTLFDFFSKQNSLSV